VVIIVGKSKDRQNHGQKKDKRTSNDLQNITHKTKDRVTRTTLKPKLTIRLSSINEEIKVRENQMVVVKY
jgi:flagella basal body P-ring formation protein FlgA